MGCIRASGDASVTHVCYVTMRSIIKHGSLTDGGIQTGLQQRRFVCRC